MTIDDNTPIHCVACSIFKRELEALREQGKISLPTHYVNSMMHMRPAKLNKLLDSVIKKQEEKSHKTLVLYGECHNHMDDYEHNSNITRVCGCNCIEILLGHETFKKLLKEGAFFLLPEWTKRWREVFQYELGLEGDIAREFMQEMHTRFIYLDTKLAPVPIDTLKEITRELGLPYEIMPITLDNLLQEINKGVSRL